jgi:hypothetical protein
MFDSAGRKCFNFSLILADCGQTLKDVTDRTPALRNRRHAPLTRLLAFVLFVFVAYGATAEVVHKHGNLGKGYAEANSSIRATNDEGSTTRESQRGDACLICQLHQNLFLYFVSEQPRLAPPIVQLAHTPTEPDFYLSHTDTPRRGRAPPLASLL